ncbi:MAG: NAD(P)-dependent oxidoreductase [Cloacibacillus porcorum]|uniref:NAD(P)-dependent oxidoreductase n=1 Tax=Cloacibacillus porcorum TaxID=1197717 RepID=UPI0023579AC4|nr:NAD(P)-dependent oxidoreductase [Cloacibacillus porcorum]MCI5865858.1 NAD(P)-dependent oxidoreductase [Cloacibacillus porcorum]
MKIGFIGLGKMGRHMAVNMFKHDTDIRVFDANREILTELSNLGIPTASSPAEIGKLADVVFLSLPSAGVVEKVLFGEGGVIGDGAKRNIIVDLGTTAYMKTLEFGSRLGSLGFKFADAPVSGMESRAASGELTLMFGGEQSVFDKIVPYFNMISNKVINFGGLGSGQMAKLINQLLFDINTAALSEVLALATKLGLDPQKTVEVVTSGTGRSWAAEFFAPRILSGVFNEGYAMDNAYKDLVSASEISAQLRVPMPILSAATAIYQMSLCKGLGNEGKGAMIKVYEEFLGAEFRDREV